VVKNRKIVLHEDQIGGRGAGSERFMERLPKGYSP
jgi:hypothetical protein